MELDSDSDFQGCIPLSSPSVSSPSNHSSSSNDAGSSFRPPQFASGHTLHSSHNHSPTSYSTANNPTVSYGNISDNRGHVDWPSPISTGSFFTRFSSPHSPIASLAPHSTHTLPFTTLSRGNNEDISVRDNSSLPYYYPSEWNRDERDIPDWNRVDPPEWSRTDFLDNPSVGNRMIPPSYSMDTTNQSPGPSPSLLSSWEEPVDLGGNSQASGIDADGTVSSLSTFTDGTVSSLSTFTLTRSGTNSETTDSPLFGEIPTNYDTGEVRMTQSRRESIGQYRRRGVSYSSDEHQSILQDLLLSPQPGTSTPYSSFSPRPYGPLSSNRITTIRLGQSSRFTPDVLSDDYTTRRRSARVYPGRSRLDVLQVHHNLAGTSSSSSLLESDNSPVLPLEDVAGILSDIERNGFGRPPQEIQSSSRGHVTTEELPIPTANAAGISQPISISDRGDVITISSDEVCIVYACMHACVYIRDGMVQGTEVLMHHAKNITSLLFKAFEYI